ncbi:MAG: DUF3343 domain-containing protein [Clostridia bacterium]|nr:DUF3343 domain-containing protein [Clostridia bacterium]
MRSKKNYIILTFHTTQEAFACEKRCAERGLPGRLIPLPGEIDAGCGLSWRVPTEDYRAEDFSALGLSFEKIVPFMM